MPVNTVLSTNQSDNKVLKCINVIQLIVVELEFSRYIIDLIDISFDDGRIDYYDGNQHHIWYMYRMVLPDVLPDAS